MTYFEFTQRFPTENDAIDFIIKHKYPNNTFVCPNCGSIHKVYRMNGFPKNLYCNNCQYHFSALSGTIFENTHLDLRMWLYAINLVIVSRKGISALQLKRELGMSSYKGAWRMLHCIRKAMDKEDMNDIFEAIVEIDETYVGGKPRKLNNHMKDDNSTSHDNKETSNENVTEITANKRGRGTSKTPIVGIKERDTGRVHAVVANKNKDGKQLTGKQLLNILNKVCKDGTTVVTDQFPAYNILNKKTEKNFIRLQIDHNVAFSLGNGIHTNGIESFWALLKRGIHGIFHHISIQYMQNYVNEFCFRLNHRDNNQAFERLINLSIA